MNVQLLQWGLFSFMIGIATSLPLAAVIYNKNSSMSKTFTNARKLKSAHLDYFTQAFALGFAYLLEYAMKLEFSNYIVILLVFGSILNPTILLMEATPFIKAGITRVFYKILKATSPVSLLIAWGVITYQFLPLPLLLLLSAVLIIGTVIIFSHQMKLKIVNNHEKSLLNHK